MRGWKIWPLLALPLAGACTPNDPTLGGALRTSYAHQVIDPEPQYAGEQVEGGDGQHSAAAVDRYKKGTVKQPRSIRTTSSINGRGGGGGGGSGN